MQCIQTEQRLSSLAMIHINYDVKIDIDSVCQMFIEKYPRRMEHANMLFSNYIVTTTIMNNHKYNLQLHTVNVVKIL